MFNIHLLFFIIAIIIIVVKWQIFPMQICHIWSAPVVQITAML